MAVNVRTHRPVRNLNERISRWAGKSPLQCLQEVGADWKAEMVDLQTVTGIKVEDKKAILNPITNKILGIAGTGYTPMHNRTLADSMSQLAESLGQPIEITEAFNTAGGKLVGLAGKIGEGESIIPGDDVIPIISIAQGNAANYLLKFRFELMRLVCSNGSRVPVDGMSTVFHLRHTKTVEARYTLNFETVLKNFDEMQNGMLAAFRKFATHKLSLAGATSFFRDIAKVKGDKDKKAEQTVEDLLQVYNHPRQVIAGETLWRAYNAATEYLQHWGYRSDESMIIANLDGKATEHKDAAYTLALALAS